MATAADPRQQQKVKERKQPTYQHDELVSARYVDGATGSTAHYVDDDQSEEEFIQQQEDQEPTTLLGHLNRIAEAETEVEPTPDGDQKRY